MYKDKWNQYEVGKVKFINNNADHLYHQMYIDYVKDNPDVKSILEIGPGEMREYPVIRGLRDIDYSVVEISKSFTGFIKSEYPEVKIITTAIESFTSSSATFDLVRMVDVLEHTCPVTSAIKNTIECAKRFHITLFKWSTGGDNLVANVRRDSRGFDYFSTEYPILLLLDEINKYGQMESIHVVNNETGKVMPLSAYWAKNHLSSGSKQKSIRGHRIVITGFNKKSRPDKIKNEVGPEVYNNFWRENPRYNTSHPYIDETIMLMCKSVGHIDNVLEVGAGFGHMAKDVITRYSPTSYTAYEFSDAMDSMSKLLEPLETDCTISLFKDTFRDVTDFYRYDCVIALEIFEHINWDLEFIEKIRRDTWVFFSIPTKPSKFHVRHFLMEDEVRVRYGELLDIKEIVFAPNKWHCVAAKRR
ncbi:class I SAM-dependent methyltransferase [Candidatus Pacearchaeota archaeon]|nr:class I SAM-dependent methyltransferase [Candidatus Pacearchaeota archaeon]